MGLSGCFTIFLSVYFSLFDFEDKYIWVSGLVWLAVLSNFRSRKSLYPITLDWKHLTEYAVTDGVLDTNAGVVRTSSPRACLIWIVLEYVGYGRLLMCPN